MKNEGHSGHGLADAPESAGQRARSELQSLAVARWPGLTAQQQRAFGGSPEAALASICERAALLGKTEVLVPSRSVAERRQRAIDMTGVDLPHLGPEGASALREREGFRPSPLRLKLRPYDDFERALGRFALRDIPPMQKKLRTLLKELTALAGTPVARIVTSSLPDAGRNVAQTLDGLDWYERTFLPSVLKESKKVGKRKLPDLRARVVQLARHLKVMTGSNQYDRLAALLNWLAPRANGIWDPRRLRRWTRGALAV